MRIVSLMLPHLATLNCQLCDLRQAVQQQGFGDCLACGTSVTGPRQGTDTCCCARQVPAMCFGACSTLKWLPLTTAGTQVLFAAAEYSPFYGIEKGAVLQEARVFNDSRIDARRCQQVSHR